MNIRNQPHIDRLTQLGLLDQYRHNCDEYGMPYEERVNIPAVTFYRFVACAFNWEHTSEGHEFWNDVANGWHKPKEAK